MRERGQAHTLEGVAAALVVIASVLFAIQITAVTPLTASTANQHIQNQEESLVRGTLASAATSHAIRPTVLRWDNSKANFPTLSSQSYYDTGSAPGPLGTMLENTRGGRHLAYNVVFHFITKSGGTSTRTYYYSGAPSDNAVSVSWTVTLYDDDHLRDKDQHREAQTLEGSSYFAPDVASNSHVYNVIQVEVVVWRM